MADIVEILMIEHLAMKRMKEKQVTGIGRGWIVYLMGGR